MAIYDDILEWNILIWISEFSVINSSMDSRQICYLQENKQMAKKEVFLGTYSLFWCLYENEHGSVCVSKILDNA